MAQLLQMRSNPGHKKKGGSTPKTTQQRKVTIRECNGSNNANTVDSGERKNAYKKHSQKKMYKLKI